MASADSTGPLDAVNRQLVTELTRDGRLTVRALAATVGLSEPSVRERLARLQRSGVITGFRAVVNPGALGRDVAAFVSLSIDPGPAVRAEVERALRDEPCVLEVHEVAGADCYLLKIRVAAPLALAEALARLREVPGVSATHSTVVLRTVLERGVTP